MKNLKKLIAVMITGATAMAGASKSATAQLPDHVEFIGERAVVEVPSGDRLEIQSGSLKEALSSLEGSYSLKSWSRDEIDAIPKLDLNQFRSKGTVRIGDRVVQLDAAVQSR